jgi:hypothetical protein
LGRLLTANCLHDLTLPDLGRAERIGEFWSYPMTRTFGELLIDLEEDKAAPTVVFGLLPEMRSDAKQMLWCETTGRPHLGTPEPRH